MIAKRYRPAIIDVEASGFGPDGYPVEVGVITHDERTYCTLILPVDEWRHWDTEAAGIHNITREMLFQHGQPVKQVAYELNQLLKGMTVHSDGWVVDKPWIIELFRAAQMPMLFNISPLEVILSEQQMRDWKETKEEVSQYLGLKRHRASSDARIIQETYIKTRYQNMKRAS